MLVAKGLFKGFWLIFQVYADYPDLPAFFSPLQLMISVLGLLVVILGIACTIYLWVLRQRGWWLACCYVVMRFILGIVVVANLPRSHALTAEAFVLPAVLLILLLLAPLRRRLSTVDLS